MSARRLPPLLLAAACMTACHHAAPDPAAVTPDEQAQLNEAAASLDANAASAPDQENRQ